VGPPAIAEFGGVTHYPMRYLKSSFMVVWLGNANGSIVAQASGVAVDVPAL